MKTKIAIVGKAASGKDHLRKQMIKRGMKFGVSTTSRAPREGEIEGKDYHFVSEEILTILAGPEWTNFNPIPAPIQ